MSAALRAMLRAISVPLAEWAARPYVAGKDLSDAVQVCERLSRVGLASTICFWNTDDDTPRRTADEYLRSIDALARHELDCYVSMKAVPLRFDHELLHEVVQGARTGGIHLHFDSLAPDVADRTFAMIAGATEQNEKIGCTLPGRWKRSIRDADRAIALGLPVRVVKGQWPDPERPDMDPRAGFLDVIDRLAGRARQVAVATHDAELARTALERLRSAGTPSELELLLGLPMRDVLAAARATGTRARVYVPYGHGWLPYCFSQAWQHPHIIWWVLRDTVLGRTFRVPGGAAGAPTPQAGSTLLTAALQRTLSRLPWRGI